MSRDDLLTYWPILLFGAFLLVRAFRLRRVKRQIPALLHQGAVIVDVRSPEEFAAGANPQSLNIPLPQLKEKLGKLDKTKPVILCCASGSRSGMAALLLKKNGYAHVVNAGNWSNTIR